MAIPRLFLLLLTKIPAFVLISFLLAACSTEENFNDTGALDTGTGVAQGTTPEPETLPGLITPLPVIEIAVSASSITRGDPVQLIWSATNANTCTASGAWSGSRDVSGFATFSPTTTSTYTLTCTGDGGTNSSTASVSVITPIPVPAVSLSASPVSIERGKTSTLSWVTSNATSCTASGGWSGSRSLSGSVSISPTVSSSFTLTCTGAGGTTSDIVNVSVSAPTPAPTVSLSSSPISIESGETATLSWVTSNATSCTASGGWSGSRTLSGSVSISPTVSSSYNLTCTGAGGTTSDIVNVTVTAPTPAPTVSLLASPVIIERGESSTLSWVTSNATSCTASGGWSGSRNLSGSATVTPAATTSYTLTCNGSGGAVSDSVTITVNDPPPAADKAINLSWVAPVEREDGTPITMSEIASYRVYYGTTAGDYPNMLEITGSDMMNATISGLTSDTYYIVVTTTDVDGRESVHSTMISASI